jgi:hypothetical protein
MLDQPSRSRVDRLRSPPGAPRLVSSTARPLLWWPALAVICLATWPGSGVGTVAGIGVALMVLGLVDFGLERHRYRRVRGSVTPAGVRSPRD